MRVKGVVRSLCWCISGLSQSLPVGLISFGGLDRIPGLVGLSLINLFRGGAGSISSCGVVWGSDDGPWHRKDIG